MLKTDRLMLRNLQAEDALEIFRYRNDEKCYRYQRYRDTSKQSIEAFIEKYRHSQYLSKEREQHYAICTLNGNIVGDISVFHNEKDNCFTLGVTVDYLHHQQGYAFEILSALIAALQAKYPTTDIVALIDRDNRASMALFEKLGFYQECYADSIASYIYVIDGRDCAE